MKKIIGLAAFVTMGLFAVAVYDAPSAAVDAAIRAAPAAQVSCTANAEEDLQPDSVICQINCCEVDSDGRCILCRRVCP